ncbi:DUF7527 domain-containing protein [Halorussus litoreus]|uniref:DUF7527 domain-containing protein n=1 Tax=Halorussus litoreus TaxID=1710536 RepID=UPI000E25F75D|nr:transcriptional regulator [Halorussus litoreus]
METRTVEQVEKWSTRSVADGYAGLRELSDGEFSGAVRAGGAWLFMLNGRIIGVFEGTLDDFEDADVTAHAAPHPSLPLLFSMQEQGGETQAKYYTNDTPLTEVDSTLTDGKFTGFIELSENVLSGDYYVAYYGGRSLSVAFVGASEQLVSGDDAFERAADEVGIYEVTDVDLQVTDVPEPEDDEHTAAAPSDPTSTDATPDAAGGGAATVESDAPAESGTDDATADTDDAGQSNSSTDSTAQTDEPSEPTSGSRLAAGSSGASETATSGASESTAASGSSEEGVDAESESSTSPSSTSSSPTGDAGPTTAADDAATGSDAQPRTSGSRSQSSDTSAQGANSQSKSTGSQPRSTETRPKSTGSRTQSTDSQQVGGRRDEAGVSTPSTTESPSGATPDSDASDDATGAASDEAEWRETTTIPSLDPDLSDGPDRAADESESGGAAAATTQSDRGGSVNSTAREQSRTGNRATGTHGASAGSERANEAASAPQSESTGPSKTGSRSGADTGKSATGADAGSTGGASGAGSAGNESGGSDDAAARARKLQKQVQQRTQQVEQLKDRLSTVESERNEFKRERDALRQEVERLEAKLEGATPGDATDAERRLGEAEAFDGTNLFVRYRSKGEATLDEAAEGKVDRGDVNGNLRLEHHTQFEADETSVDGEPFDAFLTGSFEYEFVSWLVEDLLYEIRDTGHRDDLRDLYEALPKIDRVDLHGSVSAGGNDEDTRQESFDVIVRDRMGDPLVVADLNDSRDPTTGEMMGSLVDAASAVAQRHDELAGAFQVTESFFEPEALETTEAATSGGFLSREKRASFVKLSRKRGYHLCLVEARSGDFHLNVPEL